MSDAWDGRPVEPGRDGAHWVSPPWGGLVIRYWYAGRDEWSDGFCDAHSHEGWSYLGPVLQPAEVGAREAAAWRVGRDAAAAYHEAEAKERGENDPLYSRLRMHTHYAEDIRALQPPADLAAAAATCDAVAVEREAIAADCDAIAADLLAELRDWKGTILEDERYQMQGKAEQATEIANKVRWRAGA